MNLIVLENVKKIYGEGDGKVEALTGINFTVEKGDMVAIMGPSGSGKSTLLNILGLLDKPSQGSYLLQGEEVKSFGDKALARHRNKVLGFVVQSFALIEDYSTFENIKVPLDYTKLKRKEKKARIERLLEKMGIANKKDKLPRELSGGQNQRVAIARALVNDPEVILADEPTGALDRKTGEEVLSIFESLNKEGKTVIIVTHDEKVAQRCKRVIYIEDGKIVKEAIN